MAYRILSHTWSAGSGFSQRYDARIDAIQAMAKKMANAPEMMFELVTEEEFREWLKKEPSPPLLSIAFPW